MANGIGVDDSIVHAVGAGGRSLGDNLERAVQTAAAFSGLEVRWSWGEFVDGASDLVLLLGKTGEFPKLLLMQGSGLRTNHRCHSAVRGKIGGASPASCHRGED